jgi:tetratricopeptide (TPR) repeat protein
MRGPRPGRALLLLLGLSLPGVATAADTHKPDAPKAGKPGKVQFEDRLPDDPEVQKGRDAYNAGRYNEAARRFLVLTQRYPSMPALYRALARSRSWAGDMGGAIVAYRLYLVLAPKAGDRAKIAAELDQAERKTPNPPEGVPGTAQLDMALARAKAGSFGGRDGAFGAVQAALEAGFLGPRLLEVRSTLATALAGQSRDALDRWWRPDATARKSRLDALWAGWQAQAGQRANTPADQQLADGLRGLAALSAGDADSAVEILSAASGDHRLRFALALALTKLQRDDEAAELLSGLARRNDDARIKVLHGLVLNRLGRTDEALPSLKAALLD